MSKNNLTAGKFLKQSVLMTAVLTFALWHTPPLTGQLSTVNTGLTNTILSPCTRFDERHQGLVFNTNDPLKWPAAYHKLMNEVIDEYIKSTPEVACLEDNLFPLDQDSKLFDLATKLPPWRNPANAAELRRSDIAAILNEAHRLYECFLYEEDDLKVGTSIERFYGDFLPEESVDYYTHKEHDLDVKELDHIIEVEIAASRVALERTLKILTGYQRLGPLDAELQCLQRAALDLRNSLALSANASMCLPTRIWDTRDVLELPE